MSRTENALNEIAVAHLLFQLTLISRVQYHIIACWDKKDKSSHIQVNTRQKPELKMLLHPHLDPTINCMRSEQASCDFMVVYLDILISFQWCGELLICRCIVQQSLCLHGRCKAVGFFFWYFS